MFKFGFAEDAISTAEGTANHIFVICLKTHVPVHLRLEHHKVVSREYLKLRNMRKGVTYLNNFRGQRTEG